MESNYDFCGWATKNGLRCADGRTIMHDAFKNNDGVTVPLVWNHQHGDPLNVLGHALLQNKDEGVYVYGYFNDTEYGANAKALVEHGDITQLSIYANQLQERNKEVYHGNIREVSLVHAGANPGAVIESVIVHGFEQEGEAIIKTDETILMHADEAASKQKDPEEIYATLNEEQKMLFDYAVGSALQEDPSKYKENKDGEEEPKNKEESTTEEEKEMKHNLFEPADQATQNDVLSHDAMQTIIKDGKRLGSLRDSVLEHSAEYGIDQIDYLLPDVKSLNTPPEFISREMGWVQKVISGTHHTPFSRIKSMFADITEDAARAKGYIKGKYKKEEVFSLLKRTTTPTTIYKKQKMDRDDIIDITDFDVIAWLKSEMRTMLDEEIARAILIGDGRLASDDDHINHQNIRPIVSDADLFTIRWSVNGATDEALAKSFIKAAVKSRKNYKGSGSPTLFTTEDMLTEMLLLEDTQGYRLYKSESELATAMRVSSIVTVPVLEGFKDADSKDVYGIIVNLSDYNVGADKGGAINMFEDFDINYNQNLYLIETRCSGALTKPFSAIVLRSGSTTASEEPTMKAAMDEFRD